MELHDGPAADVGAECREHADACDGRDDGGDDDRAELGGSKQRHGLRRRVRDDHPPPVVSTAQTMTTYQPASLTAGTTYFWKVDAKGAGGTTPGAVWSFTTAPPPTPAPSAVSAPTPATGATTVGTTTALSWTAASNATAYDVALGTTNPPPVVSTAQTMTTYQPASLTAGTTYFWKVDAKGAGGTTPGAVWSFSTAPPPTPAPSAVSAPTPATGATTVGTTTALSWTAASNATAYDVALGTTNPPPVVSTAQTMTTYQPASLTAGTTYFWKVDAQGAGGTTPGAVWSFTTAPPATPAASNPMPADGNANALATIAVNWSSSATDSLYTVYFGTTNPPPVAATDLTVTSYQPSATLAYSTTYYWRVDATGPGGTTASPVWRFTTLSPAAPPPDAPATGNAALSRLRVLNWNVAQGYNPVTKVNDYDLQIDLIASFNPDVVTLQEMSYSDADMPTLFVKGLSARTGRQWRGYYQRTNAEATLTTNNTGSAILTWLPVDAESQALIVNDTAHPFEALHIQVTVNGTPVHVSTTHLYAWDAAVRANQIGWMQSWLSPQGAHRIVAGDFNAFPGETTTWTDAWTTEYTDAWVTATSWVQPTNDPGYTFDKRTLTGVPERIDYEWIKGVTVSEMFVVKTRRSDHHAIVTDYNVP